MARPGTRSCAAPDRHSVMAAPLIGEGGSVRGPYGLLPTQGCVGRDGCAAPRRHRRPGGDHDHHDAAHRRARRIARGPRPPRPGGAGPARDRRADHRAARHERDPRRRRRAGVRLVRADGVILDLLDPSTGHLHWALDSGVRDLFTDEERSQLWIDIGVGATGTAVAEDRVVLAFGNLEDQFPPSPESTEFYERTGFQSMIAAPITGEAGPLGVIEVYSKRLGAFTPTDAGLVGALASQAAIAITNARLIDELGRSRAQLAQTADAERTLREIAGRVSAMRDQGEILQSVIDASARLLQASGVTIDLIDGQGMAEAWLDPAVQARTEANLELLDSVQIDPDVGVSGLAIRTRTTARTGEYLEDVRFEHTPDRDAFVRESAIHSVLAAPLIHRDEVFGVINAYSDRVDAFDDTDAGLLAALADQAAIAIANARLIEELQRSRAEIARRADSERTLREIAARVSAILEPDEVLQQITEEAARLLESDGARIDQYDPEIDALRWSYAAGDAMSKMPKWAKTGGLKPGQAVGGMAFKDRRAVLTTDYLTDDRFDHSKEIDAFIKRDAHPRGDVDAAHGRGRPDRHDLGRVAQRRPLRRVGPRGADRPRDPGVRRDPQRAAHGPARQVARGDRAARRGGARAARDRRQDHRHPRARRPPPARRRRGASAAARRRRDDRPVRPGDPDPRVGVRRRDPGGAAPGRQADVAAPRRGRLGQGGRRAPRDPRRRLPRRATSSTTTSRIRWRAGPTSATSSPPRSSARPARSGRSRSSAASRTPSTPSTRRSSAASPTRPPSRSPTPGSSRSWRSPAGAVARRADTERSLRDITARIAALREPDVILDRVVEEAARLLGTDGAHLTRMSDDGTYLVPVVVAGGADFTTQAWLLGMRFPLGGGINGLAAQRGRAGLDVRLPRRPAHPARTRTTTEVAGRLCLRGHGGGAAARPGRRGHRHARGLVRASRARSSPTSWTCSRASPTRRPSRSPTRTSSPAWPARRSATAISSRTRRTSSGRSTARAGFTFLSDAVERLTGRQADEFLGKHFGALVHGSSREVAEYDFAAGMTTGSQEIRGRVNVAGPDGEPVPAEFIATARLGEDGRFAGANGSVRDMRERDRLERELHESETRFRQLVQTSPDVIYRTDAEGRFVFIAEGAEALFGWTADEAMGLSFADFTAEESLPRRSRTSSSSTAEHDVVRRFRYMRQAIATGRRCRARSRRSPSGRATSSPGCRGRSAASASRSGWPASCRLRGALPVPGRELARRGLRDRRATACSRTSPRPSSG